ncbi:CubicO group peptidase, beta-lactamase class C family [Neorhodopirellula lusitana]|uniref:Beta-lactamase n=1 Tax=Neorhodopirellula lusitana TaxID=445327 RepID=A0ABY1QRT8_9BACT|nr:serine hydrolase domain-containing protein [Neorhodopirellula lusitana]SMP75959.1 CubicO group peptidase, beta-lactamase class C family [Neorhodopirellula lusitana]
MANRVFQLPLGLVGLVVAAVQISAAGQTASAQSLNDRIVAKIASPLIVNQVVDGLSIGYIDGNESGTVHLGVSSDAGKQPDDTTIYELGSISKVFTGLMLADAAVRGELALDAPAVIDNAAGIRLPTLDGRSIQWVDLSTHRSGLPRLPANMELTSLKDPYRLYDSKKAASALASLQLDRKPGQAQEYSNFGVSVLGYLIAQNANMSYQELLRQRIAQPLGMNDCAVEMSAEQEERFTTPHKQVGSPTSAWTFADMPGAGGVHASLSDMMRFANAQLRPPTGPLGEAIELAWKQHSAADASGSATGLGWMIHGDGETRWHNGGTGGSRTAIFINRRINSAVIVLCNTSVSNEIDHLAVQLLQLAAGIGHQPES